VRADLIGQLAPPPVLGLVEGAGVPAGDFFDLRMQIGDLLVGRVG